MTDSILGVTVLRAIIPTPSLRPAQLLDLRQQRALGFGAAGGCVAGHSDGADIGAAGGEIGKVHAAE